MRFELSLELLFALSVTCIFLLYKILTEKEMRSVILLFGALSLLCCMLYLVMDAPDVAMTEAALGVCITTIVLLKIAKLLPVEEIQTSLSTKLIGGMVSFLFGLALIYAGLDLSDFGNPDTPVHSGVNSYYHHHTYEDIGIESFVASILASYRGYDTLGETTVIFLAGLCVIMTLKSLYTGEENGK